MGLVRDLLGADLFLLGPLQDLLQRPAFREVLRSASPATRLAGRDALLQDLAATYQPALVSRLAALLDGCLGLPLRPAGWEAPPPPPPTSAVPPAWHGKRWFPLSAAPPSQPPAWSSGNSQPLLIGLLSVVLGSLITTLAWVLWQQRQPIQVVRVDPAPTQSRNFAPAPPRSEPQPRDSSPLPSPTPESPAPDTQAAQAEDVRWQACRSEDGQSAAPPKPGEIWWPVVGPADALDAARRQCRADAFLNREGNVQIASFRDRATAEGFAQALTEDNSHPYRFWLGDSTQR